MAGLRTGGRNSMLEQERLGLRLVVFGLTMFVIFGFFFEFVIFSRSSESASDSFLGPVDIHTVQRL